LIKHEAREAFFADFLGRVRASKEVAMADHIHHSIGHRFYNDRFDAWLWAAVLVALAMTVTCMFAAF